MKLKNFEKKQGILWLVFFTSIGNIFLFFVTNFIKINQYYITSAIIRNDNLLEVMINEKELPIVYKNSFFYIDQKKVHFQIYEVISDVYTQDNISYYTILLQCNISSKKLKDKDIVSLVLLDKRKKLYKIFETIWKGD